MNLNVENNAEIKKDYILLTKIMQTAVALILHIIVISFYSILDGLLLTVMKKLVFNIRLPFYIFQAENAGKHF